MAPNSIGPLGLTTATQAELLANLTAQLQAIYGADITLTSDSPDGQWMNLNIQSVLDLQDLLTQIYNTFDPDNAVGVILDQRVSINGIQRQAGTFTVTNVTLVTNQSVNLYGLDQTIQPIYTVSDNAGNLWELQTTQIGLSSGTTVLAFQAALPGAVLTVPNTITTPVTIVLGVTSLNNPTTYTTLGLAEESDANLKLRRQKSVSIVSQGYLKGLLAALENINGVTTAIVRENVSGTTDSDGIPGHSIWVIVGGSYLNSAVATAIYQKRNAGCGMFGQVSYTITQVDGTLFTVFWDTVLPQNFFFSFTATSIDGINQPKLAAIRAGLVTTFVPGVYEEVNINELATLVQAIDPNCLVTNAGFTLAQTQIITFSGVAASGTFLLHYNGQVTATIHWDDSTGAIEAKIRALTGLSTITVSGTLASQTLTIHLTTLPTVLGLFYATANSLMTGLSVAITLSFNEGYSNLLLPTAKNQQLVVTAADIICLPLILNPVSSTVHASTTLTFLAVGGYGSYVYTFNNNSNGTLNSSTGVYVSGTTVNTVDTLFATDVFGNTASATVSVVP